MKMYFFTVLIISVCPTFANTDLCSELQKKIEEHEQTHYTAGGRQYNQADSIIREAKQELEKALDEYVDARNRYYKMGKYYESKEKESDSALKITQARSKERVAVLKLIQGYQIQEGALQQRIAYYNQLSLLLKQKENNRCSESQLHH